MSKYIIEGGQKLSGKVRISGNKNSILPCLAACLLTDKEVILKNVPNVSDVGVFVEVLRSLGAEVSQGVDEIKVRCVNIEKPFLTEESAGKLRASVLVVGPLLARVGKVEFFHPGGDVIGKRSLDTHLESLADLGFGFKVKDRYYLGFRDKEISKKSEIFLGEASVTATENLLLASVLGGGEIILKNCAAEPHVVDLCNLLILMGAKIEGVGSSTLKITGVDKLGGAEFSIGSDFVAFGTYAIAAAITGGEIEIENIGQTDLEPIMYHLRKMGLVFNPKEDSVLVKTSSIKAIPKLHTNIWPGFPTDMMSVVIVLATQADGMSLCHDWMYESRMFFTDKLISMGANITVADPHRVLVDGPTKLYGRQLETPDIRAGMALVLAALIAEGKSIINRAELIERGYEDVVAKFSSLGAKIERID